MSATHSENVPNLADLQARAEKGDGDAMLRLFAALDRDGRYEEAMPWLLRLARGGHQQAATLLGERLVVGIKGAPPRPEDGALWIAAAAKAGLPEAQRRLCILAATGIGRPQSWTYAWDTLKTAAESGHAPSATQFRVFDTMGIAGPADIEAFVKPQPVNVRVASPRIVMADGLLPEIMCRWLIERARPKLQRAPVFNPSGGNEAHDIRTNSAAGFTLFDTDLVIQVARARVGAALGSPLLHQEPPQVLHYAPGERYTPHWDYFDPTIEAYRQNIAWGGQRIRTALVYLNSDFEEGETGFIKLGRAFRAGTGGLLSFDNVTPDGNVDHRTMHEGRATTQGEKWLLSIWIRDREHVPA
jgi:prolyl 4-hydroxylase